MQIVTLEADSQHPNKMKFRGILVVLDSPSQKPPNGAQGHRILVSTEVAQRRLKSLIGMGLNYAPDLDAHAQRRKVGVIDKAWIDGKDLRVEGHIWKHDFPEAEKDLKQAGLGMSMELGDVRVDNPAADVWNLDDFQFLGATILWRDSAAYNRTQAIAARAERRGSMPIPNKKAGTAARASHTDRVVQIAAEAAAGAVSKSSRQILSVLKTQTEALGGIAAQMEELDARTSALEDGTIVAARKEAPSSSSSSSSSSEGDLETRRVKAAGKTAPSSSSSSSSSEGDLETRRVKAKAKTSSSSSSFDSEDDEDMDSAMDTGEVEKATSLGDGETGHDNEDAENRGEDGAGDLIKKVGKTVESARIKALRHQLKAARHQLHQQETVHASAIAKLNKKMSKLTNQVTAASAQIGRRSVSPEISAMLAKSNIDASDLLRTGTRMSVAEVDGILAGSGLNLNAQDRMAMKNAFLRSGLMEDGRVERGTSR
jgi:hypothetical protein